MTEAILKVIFKSIIKLAFIILTMEKNIMNVVTPIIAIICSIICSFIAYSAAVATAKKNADAKIEELELSQTHKKEDEVRKAQTNTLGLLHKLLFKIQILHAELTIACDSDENINSKCLKDVAENYISSLTDIHNEISVNIPFLEERLENIIYKIYQEIITMVDMLAKFDKQRKYTKVSICIESHKEIIIELINAFREIFEGTSKDKEDNSQNRSLFRKKLINTFRGIFEGTSKDKEENSQNQSSSIVVEVSNFKRLEAAGKCCGIYGTTVEQKEGYRIELEQQKLEQQKAKKENFC